MFLFLQGDLHLQELGGAINKRGWSSFHIRYITVSQFFKPVFTKVFFVHNFQHDLAATVSK